MNLLAQMMREFRVLHPQVHFDLISQSAEHCAAILRADDPLAQKDTVTAEDLLNRDLILPRRMSVQSLVAHWFGLYYDKLRIYYSANLTTNGSVLVSRRLFPDLSVHCVLCSKRGVPMPAAADAFVSFAREYLKQF